MAQNDNYLLQSSVLNAAFSIIFQILCRLLTFGINAYIVRNVGRDVLGIMNVRLLLLESTLLFLSREAINRASLSAATANSSSSKDRGKNCSWAQLINQMWLPVPACLLLSIPSIYIWLHWLSPVDALYSTQYRFACYAVALSCVVELCAEAPVFVTQVFCFVKLKIVLNTLHILVRSAIFLWIVTSDGGVAIYAFAVAQLASSVVIFAGHYGFFHVFIGRFNKFRRTKEKSDETPETYKNMDGFPFTSVAEMFPMVLANNDIALNAELQTLTFSFMKQGVLKLILTEGEKYVMSVSPVMSFSQQATYDVVNNLGSLAARFIFRPIEDSSYFFFTQTISRDVQLQKQDKDKVKQAGRVLSLLGMGVTSIGLLALTFGQSYSHAVLLLYGGADFVAGGLPANLLQWHCLAILFLAVNGITEGYMFATNTSTDIDKYNYLMAIFSLSFLVLSYALTWFFGPVGFIFANCINMFCRICYSTNFIYKQYQPVGCNPLMGLLPGPIFILALIVVGLFCKYSMYHTESMLWHFGFGCGGVLVCLLAWALQNRGLVRFAWSQRRRVKID